jgi:dTDP-4-amino-4,6-dideoxygalactose transaminase
MLAYQALAPRGPVVLPSMTFAASAHAVVWAGGTPRFADVDPHRLTLDPADAAAALDGAGALSATHTYGAPAQVEALEALAAHAGIPLVFDAAHALGSLRQGRPIGGFGTVEVFSLSPTKVVVAGEGGLVATADAALAERIRLGRDYGNPGNYDFAFPGLNARMSELHAAVALASLQGLDERVAYRNHLVQEFRAATQGVPGLGYQHVDNGDTSTYKDLTLLVDPDAFGVDVSTLALALQAEGIDSRRYYLPPIHRQQAYAHLRDERHLPVTDDVSARVLTPPLYSHMTEAEMRRVADVVVDVHRNAAAVRGVVGAHRSVA